MPPRTRDERLFGAACLKLTLAKTMGERAAGAEIYDATLSDLGLSDDDVERYLAEHRALVEEALQKRGRHGG